MSTRREAKSTTKSSKSNTAKTTQSGSQTPIQFVKGVGPRLGAVLESRGISTVGDLLHFFPRAYEDRNKISKVIDLPQEGTVSVALTVESARRIPIRGAGGRPGRTLFEVRASDETGSMGLKWFYVPRGMDARFKMGQSVIATGTLKRYQGRPEIIHPEISFADASKESIHVGRIVPVYVEIEGLSTRLLRSVLHEAVTRYVDELPEDLPRSLREKHALPSLAAAIRAIHFPETVEGVESFSTPGHQRLIFEEFLKFQYLLLKQRLKMQKEAATPYATSRARKAVIDAQASLPFKLTRGQSEAVQAVLDDLAQPYPMNRLIQGDVGSGKTAVAFLTALAVLSEGGQTALMAPTEILAEQHYKNAKTLFGDKVGLALLTGSTPQTDRDALMKRLAAGEPLLVIGTHALLEDPVQFKDLGLILIDEQHRFGVEQRRTLRNKGIRARGSKRLFPHVLILTATPIPRTLALTAYGDLAVSSIRELPPGRVPITTRVCESKAERDQALELIRTELKAGRQAYFIYPLVSESEAEGFTHLKAAESEFERLKQEFEGSEIGLLHGQVKAEEKARVMNLFREGKIDVLVSTTVVEVGVDNPNASIIVIEHAERFGLSQLHQLRGRVGRGKHASYCFLFSHPNVADVSAHRLSVLEDSQDGFKIAEADLEIRGPGEFLGTKQAGSLPFKIGNIVRDREWLIKAREDAVELLKRDPELQLPENTALRAYYEREGKLQFERLKTS